MIFLRQYILSVICISIICGIILDISRKSIFIKQMKLVCGLILLIALVSPIIQFDLPDIDSIITPFVNDSESVIEEGRTKSSEMIASVIQQEAESYIASEACKQMIVADVKIQLDHSDPPKPYSILTIAHIDNNSKEILEQKIEAELGIPKERQEWMEPN